MAKTAAPKGRAAGACCSSIPHSGLSNQRGDAGSVLGLPHSPRRTVAPSQTPSSRTRTWGPCTERLELNVAQVQQAPWVETAAGPHRRCCRKGKQGSGQTGRGVVRLIAAGAPTCLAEGVMPCCTTMRARVMFSSCMRWQYTLMVLIPTLGSSAGRVHVGPQSQVPCSPLPRHVWHHFLGFQFPSL